MKKTIHYDTPDLSKLHGVALDHKTTIFIALGADPVNARNRYLYHIKSMVKFICMIKSGIFIMKENL